MKEVALKSSRDQCSKIRFIVVIFLKRRLKMSKDYIYKSRKIKTNRAISIHTENPKILLVEDNEIAQMINSKILTSVKFNVDVAENYWRAINLYSKNQYDLILLDIGLPGKSGIDLCKEIRKQEQNSDTHIPIIALTAFGEFAEDDCYDAGVDAFAVKPLYHSQLIELVCRLLPKDFFI